MTLFLTDQRKAKPAPPPPPPPHPGRCPANTTTCFAGAPEAWPIFNQGKARPQDSCSPAQSPKSLGIMCLGRREVERGRVVIKSSSKPSWNSPAPSTVHMETLTARARLCSGQEDGRSEEHTWGRESCRTQQEEGGRLCLQRCIAWAMGGHAAGKRSRTTRSGRGQRKEG